MPCPPDTAQSAGEGEATALLDPSHFISAETGHQAKLGTTQEITAPSSPRCLGCCSDSGGSRYRIHGCTGDPWKNVVCRWWPAPGAQSSQKGPQRTLALWLEREQGMAPTAPAPPPVHQLSPRGLARQGWALTRKQELKREVVLSSRQGSCRDRRGCRGEGAQEP